MQQNAHDCCIGTLRIVRLQFPALLSWPTGQVYVSHNIHVLGALPTMGNSELAQNSLEFLCGSRKNLLYKHHTITCTRISSAGSVKLSEAGCIRVPKLEICDCDCPREYPLPLC